MWRWCFFLLLIPTLARAEPATTAPKNYQSEVRACYLAGVKALAKSKNMVVNNLPGIEKSTNVRVYFRDDKASDFSVDKSSGNEELDKVALDCAEKVPPIIIGSGREVTIHWRWQDTFQDLPAGWIEPRASNPHICVNEYPAIAMREGHQGSNAFLFNVSERGTVADLIVAISSGYRELDLAGVRCVLKWSYEPAQNQGKPTVAPTSTFIGWSLGTSVAVSLPTLRKPLVNCFTAYPDGRDKAVAAGNAVSVVRYHISDGAVTDVEIAQSTGDVVVDGYASACVKSWRFYSTDNNDRPATGTYLAIIDWGQKTALIGDAVTETPAR